MKYSYPVHSFSSIPELMGMKGNDWEWKKIYEVNSRQWQIGGQRIGLGTPMKSVILTAQCTFLQGYFTID